MLGTMDKLTIEERIKDLAEELGFDGIGFTGAEPFSKHQEIALARLEDGLMGELSWYTPERIERGSDPAAILPGGRSIISLAMSYYSVAPDAPTDDDLHGRVSNYAWGQDYHALLKKKLKVFITRLSEVAGETVRAKAYNDTGPVQDRAIAERAGVGWFGKNTNILTSKGSWVFLAEVITDMELQPDVPLKKTCGTCTLCIEACPTGALIAPYVLDSNRCISYLTIELRGAIPRELRPLVGDWIFGCDICQDVCPVNRKAELTKEYGFYAKDMDTANPRLLTLLTLSDEEFAAQFRGSPIRRAKNEGMKRNVCVALGNIGDERAVSGLTRALMEESALVRCHAAWALGRIGGDAAIRSLREALAQEHDHNVIGEIEYALDGDEE